VTVRGLSVSRYVGAPPAARSAWSMHQVSVPSCWSQAGITTRNRDQASHAENSWVCGP
jgi:hypothetical protein